MADLPNRLVIDESFFLAINLITDCYPIQPISLHFLTVWANI